MKKRKAHVRILTPEQARQKVIEAAKGNPTLVDQLKLEKDDPEGAEYIWRLEIGRLVDTGIRLGKQNFEILYWVHHFCAESSVHLDDLNKWYKETNALAEERIAIFVHFFRELGI
jgi:hypothetical protein